ncbi:MAG: hypothetical protein ACC657_18430, partial [Thiohalomonadales bacterium]
AYYLMKSVLLLTALLYSTTSVGEGCASSPSEAYGKLKAAYLGKDIDSAVSAINFKEWAKLTLESTEIQSGQNDSEALKVEYIKHLEKSGFPNYQGMECVIDVKDLDTRRAVIEEICRFAAGEVGYRQAMNVVKNECGWLLAGAYMPNKRLQIDAAPPRD